MTFDKGWNEVLHRLSLDEKYMTPGNQLILDLKQDACMRLLIKSGFTRDQTIEYIGWHGIDEVWLQLLLSENGIPADLLNYKPHL